MASNILFSFFLCVLFTWTSTESDTPYKVISEFRIHINQKRKCIFHQGTQCFGRVAKCTICRTHMVDKSLFVLTNKVEAFFTRISVLDSVFLAFSYAYGEIHDSWPTSRMLGVLCSAYFLHRTALNCFLSKGKGFKLAEQAKRQYSR